MKQLIYSVVFLSFLYSCGGESDTFESAKIHKCNMMKYANEIKDGKDSQAKLEEATSMFEACRDNCINDEGMKDFDEKIKEEECE